ncbi:MAG: hypothetical protein R3E32_01365 [Chitinophagales bacterium]
MKSRFSSILLIFILIAPIFLTYSWLQCQKSIVKNQVKTQLIATIEKEELVLLKFSKTEAKTKLKWEHSKEFEFDQQMYDVIESESVGDSIFYWCWWDYEETELNHILKELVDYALGNDSQNKKNQTKLISYLKSLYCTDNFEWDSDLQTILQQEFFTHSIDYLSLSSSPSTPPPKLG